MLIIIYISYWIMFSQKLYHFIAKLIIRIYHFNDVFARHLLLNKNSDENIILLK